MNKKHILVVSNKQDQDSPLGDWTKIAHPFHVNVVNNDEAAIEWCHLHQFDLVVVDESDSAIDSKKLNAVLPILQDDITVLKYEGETTEKLSENIEAIFDAKKYQRLNKMLVLEPAINSVWNLPQFSLN